MASSSDDEVRYQALKESIDNIRDDIARLYSIINTSTDNCTSVDETAGEEINSGDTSWMMVATTLVLLMTTPGIMLYYSGLVRLQNVLSTAMQGYSIACLVTFLWLCFGYSLAFAPSNSTGSNPTPLFGDATRFWLNEMTGYSTHEVAPTIPESVFCAYHLAFAIITPSLICGAFADRMRYIPMLICIGLWHLIVYCPLAHATWHPDGFLKKQGVLDFAGGCVVHVSAGFSALVSAVIIGQRTGLGKFQFHPHNMLISITGATFLWLGWFGFIAGSAYKANNHAGMSFLNTQIASGVGSLAWIAVDIFQSGRPSIIGIVNGTLSGLVAITPAAGYVDTTASFIIGFCGGFLCCLGVRIKTIFQFDDALDAFGIHGIGGVVGTFLTGCFAHHKYQAEAGAFYGSPGQLKVQVYCILFTVAWSTILSFCIFWLVDVLIGLRVSVDVEKLGLDRMEHGSSMYSQLRNIPKRRLRQSSSNEVARQPQQQHQQQQLNVTKFFSSIFSTLSSHPQNDNTDLEHSSDFGSLDSDRLSGRENLAIVHVSGQASTELTNISNKQGKSAETKCEDF